MSRGEIVLLQIDEALSMLDYAIRHDARETLLMMNIADYPNMAKENRKRLFMEIRKQAYPEKRKGITFAEFAKRQKNGEF